MTLRASITALAFALVSLGLSGCGPQSNIKSPVIESEVVERLLGPANPMALLIKQAPEATYNSAGNGVKRAKVIVPLPKGGSMALWVYQPDPLPASKLPCVFIAPAGTRLVHGLKLTDGDQDEHLPWVKAGFAVVAYELSGDPGSDNASNAQMKIAAEAFRAADSGLLNARVAMAYAREKVPFIDSRRFYTAGHSSAGTMALYVAEMEPQVKACAAFMPAVDIRAWLGTQGMTVIQQSEIVPDAGNYVTRISPVTYIDRLSQPVFLAYVGDDDPGITRSAKKFGEQLRKMGRDVTILSIPSGGHFEPMINDALPMAIDWLKMVNSLN